MMPSVTVFVKRAEGRADRHDWLPDFQDRRIAQVDRGRDVTVDVQHRQVADRVGAEQFRFPLGAVHEDDHEFVTTGDDMLVRDDPSVVVDDESGARTGRNGAVARCIG